MKLKFNVSRKEHINCGSYSFVEIGIEIEGSGDFASAADEEVKSIIKELNSTAVKFCSAERKNVEKLIQADTFPDRK